MSGLKDIPVTVTAQPPAATQQVNAIVSEIESMLRTFVATGEAASIDLRSLPLFPGDYDALIDALGEGEVQATVRALGPTSIRETGYPGVWWVIHYNSADEVMAELIEVTDCPEILRSQKADLVDSLVQLTESNITAVSSDTQDDGRHPATHQEQREEGQ